MSTFVLVHGGGHGGWCYQKVARRLRAAGHDVYAPSLTGLADRSHLVSSGVDLDTHIDDITSLLHYEDLTDSIVVGHSYGGMVITGVGDRSPDRVGKLVSCARRRSPPVTPSSWRGPDPRTGSGRSTPGTTS